MAILGCGLLTDARTEGGDFEGEENETHAPISEEIGPGSDPQEPDHDMAAQGLVGTWTGLVEGGSESGGPWSEIRQIVVVEECELGNPCLIHQLISEPEFFALVEPYHTYDYCFGDSFVPQIHQFCFSFIDENTVDYFGAGGLWGEEGILRRTSNSPSP
jgi:hypothetical protein